MVLSAIALAVLVIAPLGGIPASRDGIRASLDERDAIHEYTVAIEQDTLRAIIFTDETPDLRHAQTALAAWRRAAADPDIPASHRDIQREATAAHQALAAAVEGRDPTIIGPAFAVALGAAESGLQASNALIDRRLGQMAIAAPSLAGISPLVDKAGETLQIDRVVARHARLIGQLGVELAIADIPNAPHAQTTDLLIALREADISAQGLHSLDHRQAPDTASASQNALAAAHQLIAEGNLSAQSLVRFWPLLAGALNALSSIRDDNDARLEQTLSSASRRAIAGAIVAGTAALALAAAAPIAVIMLRRRVLRPVLRLHAATDATLAEDAAPWNPVADDEIGDLTRSFKEMAKRIQQQNAQLQNALIASNQSRDALAESVAKLSEADRLRQHILNTASHELRTPLTPMRIHMNLLGKETSGPLTAAQRRSLAALESNMDRLVGVVSAMTQMHELQTGQAVVRMQDIDVNEVAAEAVGGVRAAMAAAELTCRFEKGEGVKAHADAARLRQVIDIVLDNARRYTPSGGHVTLRILAGPLIEVTDDGIGMDPDNMDRLFTPFERGLGEEDAPGAAGLGLAIARALMQQMGGELTGHSEGLGKGSTFRIRLQPPSL